MLRLTSAAIFHFSLILAGVSISFLLFSLSGLPERISRGSVAGCILIVIWILVGSQLDDAFVLLIGKSIKNFSLFEWYLFVVISSVCLVAGLVICFL
jgi:hypothetical protein